MADAHADLSVWGFDDKLISRIVNMRSHRDETEGVYYINHLPLNLGFGVFDMSNFVVKPDNTPVTAWVVGRITACKVVNEQGFPRKYIFVGVETLTDMDVNASIDICDAYSDPRPRERFALPHGKWFIGAGCYGPRNGWNEPPELFAEVYPATEIMYEGPQIDVCTLKRGDLILMEMRVKKWFSKDNQAYEDLPQHAGVRYHGIGYELQKIHLLKSEDVPDYCF